MTKFIKCSIGSNPNEESIYWIYITSDTYGPLEYDKYIAEFLGIPLKQYQDELLQFNTEEDESRKYYDRFKTDVIFYKLKDVNNALEYMENKYNLFLKLLS